MSKAVAKRVPTPKPVVVEQVCDICDEDWAEHPENPTVMDCLEILKAKKIKLTLKDLQGLHACCGHGHNCCHSHHWHYWYNTPIQVTPTYQPVWVYNTGGTTNTIGISPQLSGTYTSPQISNPVTDVTSAQSLVNALSYNA